VRGRRRDPGIVRGDEADPASRRAPRVAEPQHVALDRAVRRARHERHTRDPDQPPPVPHVERGSRIDATGATPAHRERPSTGGNFVALRRAGG
jgi:hypothetical protein